MKMIVLVSDQVERANGFISLLNAMFPECDIHVVSSCSQGPEGYPEERQEAESSSVVSTKGLGNTTLRGR